MSQEPIDHDAQTRDAIVKSGLAGVAATVLAVTMFSPAGLGGAIGTSLASGFGADSDSASSDDVYGRLPPFPSPISQEELSDIRGQLARTTASLEITRAATDARIEHIRSIAMSEDVVTFAPMPSVGQSGQGISIGSMAPVELLAVPISVELAQPRDSHLEFAALLLARDGI